MIGHYLLHLTPAQEDRVLTTKLAYAPWYIRDDGCRCLVGTVEDLSSPARVLDYDTITGPCPWLQPGNGSVGTQFYQLCQRFGEERVNRVIRERILANKARRVLTQPALAPALADA